MAFKDIKGQDKTIGVLKSHLKSALVAGTYLFTGPEGVGKSLAAKTFAKSINCLNAKDDACDLCPSCIKIDKNQHPDVWLIEPFESEVIKIEAIRDLKRNISLRPYEAKKKVFIINDAHKMKAEAANALLKILEEPPVDSLFKTIISRCQTIKFYPLKRTGLEELLKNDYRLDNELAHFLAYFCEGRIGAALNLKDTDILREKNRIIDAFSGSRRPIAEDMPLENRDQVRKYLNLLISWFRDIYLIKVGLSHRELINLDRRQDLLKSMNRYDWFELEEIFKSISDSLLYVQQNINIKLLLANLRAQVWK
jgi:DNA polymerase-3 subunit delta'